MDVFNYSEFLTENKIFELINESKLVFSKEFINMLNNMEDKLAKELMELYRKDVDDLAFNYINITDKNSYLEFTSDVKVQQAIGDKTETYKVINTGRYLTHSSKNDEIFEKLGYDKSKQGLWVPSTYVVGLILKEVISKSSGNTYVLFEGIENKKLSVLNKEALEINETYQKIWGTGRNPISVGKLTRAILNSANINFSFRDLEKFVNSYKATYDMVKNKLKQFKVVKGDDIAHWYDVDNYYGIGGILNNSCMANSPSYFFNLYTENSVVSLVIFYDDNGKFENDEYKSNKIKGRALLWDCKINGKSIKFLDRIYTVFDSDINLFKEYANNNGWWYKKEQNLESDVPITNGSSVINGLIIVDLEETEFDDYPYLDTLPYLSYDNKTLSNDSDGANITLEDTEGGYSDIE